jgi:hypothetical protein
MEKLLIIALKATLASDSAINISELLIGTRLMAALDR